MVRVTEVPIVEEPDVPDVGDLVVLPSEELVEIFCGLHQVSQPDHCGQIGVSSLDELASQLHLVVVLLISGLYNITMIIIKVLIGS